MADLLEVSTRDQAICFIVGKPVVRCLITTYPCLCVTAEEYTTIFQAALETI